MASVNLLDTNTTSFGELIGNGKIYKVPDFQRDYSWREQNWEDLWQDLLALYEGPEAGLGSVVNRHYMGSIVLQRQQGTEKIFKIIDGQQRLATISIIAIAVIEKISQLAKQEIEVKNNREREEILRRTYLSDRDPSSLKYSSKLILNENNDDFFQSRLINLRPPRNIRAIKSSNRYLWQAFEYFSAKLDEIDKVAASGAELAEFLTSTVARDLLFIQINVEDELNAYTLFETLNARGMDLSATDLLKNYLFSLFQGPDDLKEAQRLWRNIIATVQMEKFPEFLRYFLSLSHVRVRSGQLFRVIRRNVTDAEAAFNLIEDLENYSSLYIALGNPNDEFWWDAPEHIPLIRELNTFRVKQAYPVLFAAFDKFDNQNFTNVLRLVVTISFRYTIVAGLNPNDLEKLYNQAAIAIVGGTIKTPRQLFEHLRSIYVSDEKFKQDFSLLSIPTKGQKKQLVRYILSKLEEDAAPLKPDADEFSIEHILPESLDESWQAVFSEDQAESFVYRLGNLTPLEVRLNRQIGNDRYEEKLEAYKTSAYHLTQLIAADSWSPDAISKRQERLAKRAVHVWSSRYLS